MKAGECLKGVLKKKADLKKHVKLSPIECRWRVTVFKQHRDSVRLLEVAGAYSSFYTTHPTKTLLVPCL